MKKIDNQAFIFFEKWDNFAKTGNLRDTTKTRQKRGKNRTTQGF
jgi:hypothetical protein